MSYRIDLTPNASYTETVSVSQDDVGREVVVDLYLDGTAYTPTTGTTITMQGTKPSGLGYTITGTASGSTVTFLTTEEMTQEAGWFASEIVLTNGTTIIGSANFALFVEKNPHPEGTIDGTGETMQSLTVRMDALEDEVDALDAAKVDATGVDAGYVPTADGQDGWSWEAQSGGGLTEDIKQSLLNCFNHVAWIDEHGQDYVDALEDALYPPASLVRISAVYTQSGTVYDNQSLDDLKADLVVTARYSDGTAGVVTTYALSGSLVAGESTITVTYGGKTTMFTVTVTHRVLEYVTDGLFARWDGIDNTGTGHDSSATVWKDLVGNYDLDTIDGAIWDDNGLIFNADTSISSGYAKSSGLWSYLSQETIEIVLQPNQQSDTRIVANLDLADRKTRRIVLFSDNTIGLQFEGAGVSANTWENPEPDFTTVNSIVGVYSGDTTISKVFVNNEQVSQTSYTHSFGRNVGHMYVLLGKAQPGDGGYKYVGKIMAVRVYNRMLSDAEIAQNYAVDVERFGLAVS